MASTAFFINILQLKYEEGEYEKSINDKTAFKWFFYFTLYTPTYKLLNVVIIPPLKSLYLLMIGCKIGKNVYLAGDEWIIDPCVTEIGENTMIGGRTIITAHVAEDKLIIKKVKIGKNCLIGGDSLILPGVNTENNVIVGSKTLITKNTKLKEGKMYVGIPAKEKT
jgi:acetyltransferase-like isoleucine patch superfamily enzyme